MSTSTTKDGTTNYDQDWGSRPVVTFSHGWPLTADAGEAQMFFLASKGCRCITHDRRGHGRSSQPWNGNERDTYAADLAELFVKLDLKNVTMIGHSTGRGEVAVHWTSRNQANGEGCADGRRAAHAHDRGQSGRFALGKTRTGRLLEGKGKSRDGGLKSMGLPSVTGADGFRIECRQGPCPSVSLGDV